MKKLFDKIKTYLTSNLGTVKRNPVLRLILGICPAFAVTTVARNGVMIGIAVTVILICANAAITPLYNLVPKRLQVPVSITIIALLTSIVQMLVKFLMPEAHETIGIYLPLAFISCIVLSRADKFAEKKAVVPSLLDGLFMGVGYTVALTLISALRELLGAGTLFSHNVTAKLIDPMAIFVLPAGGFFVFAMLIAIANLITKKCGKATAEQSECEDCRTREQCKKSPFNTKEQEGETV